MSNISEAWETDDGKLSDYEGVVYEAAWVPNNMGVLNLELKNNTDNPDSPTWGERFGTGKEGGWKSFDGGITAETDQKGKFHENSGMGKLINRVREILGDDLMEVLGDSPRNSQIWVGTKWFWEADVNEFTDRTTGKLVKFSQNLPTKYLGRVDPTQVVTPADSQAVQSPVTPPNPAPNVAPTPTATDPMVALANAGLVDEAKAAAAGTHSEFADKMLEVLMAKGLLGTPDGDMLIQAVADEGGLFTTLRAG